MFGNNCSRTRVGLSGYYLGPSMPSAKQQISNIKHGGHLNRIWPTIWTLINFDIYGFSTFKISLQLKNSIQKYFVLKSSNVTAGYYKIYAPSIIYQYIDQIPPSFPPFHNNPFLPNTSGKLSCLRSCHVFNMTNSISAAIIARLKINRYQA